MKKITMICMSALLLLAVSCKKDKNTENDNTGRGLRVAAETHAGDSKTHLDGVAVRWDLGDEILVGDMDLVGMHKFKAESDDDGSGIVFFEPAEGEDVPEEFYTGYYSALYPSNCLVEEDNSDILLPRTQTYAEGTFALNANPMVGFGATEYDPDEFPLPVCENADITFYNLCGLLKLQLYAESACTVKSIDLTTNKEGEMLWGKGHVSVDNIDEYGVLFSLTDDESNVKLWDGGNTLTLDCGDGVAMSTDAFNPTIFYFVVPPLTLTEGFTVKVTDTDGNVWTKTTTKNNQIYRSMVTVMPVQEVCTSPQDPVTPQDLRLYKMYLNGICTVIGMVTVPDGSHSCQFGFVYGKESSPVLDDAEVVQVHTLSQNPISGTVVFVADLLGLDIDEVYYVRAFANCSSENSEAVYSLGTTVKYKPENAWTDDKSPMPFSISETQKVFFSQGNLQYKGSASMPYWKFADHQYDFIAYDIIGTDLLANSGLDQSSCYGEWIAHTMPGQNSAAVDADRDLFGWGDLTGCETSKDDTKYGWTEDWGTKIGEGWRTLSKDEWVYLIEGRTNASNLYGIASIGEEDLIQSLGGAIILPDEWNGPAIKETYTFDEWTEMENAGAVFLPAAGQRQWITPPGYDHEIIAVFSVFGDGDYWTSSLFASKNYTASRMLFRSGLNSHSYGGLFNYGYSVRLVKDATTK